MGMVISLGVLWLFLLVKSFSYKSEILNIRQDVAEAESRSTRLFSVRDIWRSTEGDLGSIEERFIREDEVPSFISMLEGQAETSSVKADLSGIIIDPANKNSPFRFLRVRVNVSGSWSDLISFVHSLDTMAYASRVDKISLSKSADSADPNISGTVWNAVVDISQYIK